MSEAMLRRGPIPWRRLALTSAVTTTGVVLLGLLLGVIGVGVRIPFLVGLGLAAAGLSWLVGRVLDPAEMPVSAAWESDTGHPATRNLDRRVRVLERYLWGIQPSHRMNRSEVQRILTALVLARRRGPTGRATDPAGSPLPAVLADYLDADPPPALTRRQLRTILKETSRL